MTNFPQPKVTNSYPYGFDYRFCMDPHACRMRVDGKGTLLVQPDTAVVILGVSTESKQLKLAQEENSGKVADIIGTLGRMGVPSEEIQTQSYTIDPQYDYIEGQQVFRGYRVVHTLRITIGDIERTGEMIDAAVESGANIVEMINFTVSDPSAYYRQALSAAIDDAANKAKTIGRKLRITVFQVPVQITEEEYRYSLPKQPALLQAAETATPIQTGQIEITAQIRAVFTYTPAYQAVL